MNSVKLYLGGFAAIVGVLGFLGLINLAVWIRNVKIYWCPQWNMRRKLENEEDDKP